MEPEENTLEGSRKRKRKHDKNADKIKTKKPKTVRKNEKTGLVVNIPKTAKDCGANWKMLSEALNAEKAQQQKIENKKSRTNKFVRKGKNKASSEKSNSKNVGQQKPEIWFDDVDPEEIKSVEEDSSGLLQPQKSSTDKVLIKPNAFDGLTKAIGMDCEMVGVGNKGSQSILARVSMVNQFGKCIYDKHVKPRENVTDYRTWVSGIRPSDLKGAEEFLTVQREVAEILKGRFLVGHALWNDLKVLYLDHPKNHIRDTAQYKPFRELNKGRTPSLRMLSSQVLGVQVQKGEHSSVQDAQAAMKLYMMHKKQWEKELKLQKKERIAVLKETSKR